MSQVIELEATNQWDQVLEKSNEEPVLVFKHSTTCPISASAYNEFIAYETNLDKYFVKVIESRTISNQIESDLGITHQSPQIFLIHNKDVQWHASHWKITEKEIEMAVMKQDMTEE